MGKQPYIPLYIGDWEQDTNMISLEAEGALIKLIFKLWKSPDRGRIKMNYFALSLLLKKDENTTKNILNELSINEVLTIKEVENGMVLIESRRMVREVEIALINSENGKKGGRPKSKKRIKSEIKAKQKRPLEYENEYDIEINNKKGVEFPFDSETFSEAWEAWKQYKKDQWKFSYKSGQTEQIALKNLNTLAGGNENTALEIIEQSIANGWKGFFELKKNGKQKESPIERAQRLTSQKFGVSQ